ncbi:hypothetical protein MTR67_025441 [Solanum verrucosum]|uniref:Uncharacterized protein n=1 Tax=Solanum verrucosum TaxID=315347 RepID=A0AAF0QYT2_SOLVR|nr:hypothetical protein MTR67_025441 [Solanum verrucosum]
MLKVSVYLRRPAQISVSLLRPAQPLNFCLKVTSTFLFVSDDLHIAFKSLSEALLKIFVSLRRPAQRDWFTYRPKPYIGATQSATLPDIQHVLTGYCPQLKHRNTTDTEQRAGSASASSLWPP